MAGPIEVQVARDRYGDRSLTFAAFHAAHFLLQVGADGVNYLAPDAKYRPDAALLPLGDDMPGDLLQHPERLRRIASIHSGNYAMIGTRHRGAIFSDTLERMLGQPSHESRDGNGAARFRCPDIL